MKVTVDFNEREGEPALNGTWTSLQALIKAVVATLLVLAAAYHVLVQVPVLVQWLGL